VKIHPIAGKKSHLDGYLMKEITMVIVNKAIDVIKTLWPQRAIRPSMFTPR